MSLSGGCFFSPKGKGSKMYHQIRIGIEQGVCVIRLIGQQYCSYEPIEELKEDLRLVIEHGHVHLIALDCSNVVSVSIEMHTLLTDIAKQLESAKGRFTLFCVSSAVQEYWNALARLTGPSALMIYETKQEAIDQAKK